MTARELHNSLRSNCPWVVAEHTVDRFKAGNPEAEVRGIAVSWMSRSATLKAAHEQGLNLFVTHEPTFWDHTERPVVGTEEGRKQKRAWLAETGMVVIRCHDMLDQMPGFGIQDSWATWLGLGGCSFEQMEAYRRIYTTEPRSLATLAREVAAKLAPLGQHWVEYLGDDARCVERVGVGTGAIVGGTDVLARSVLGRGWGPPTAAADRAWRLRGPCPPRPRPAPRGPLSGGGRPLPPGRMPDEACSRLAERFVGGTPTLTPLRP